MIEPSRAGRNALLVGCTFSAKSGFLPDSFPIRPGPAGRIDYNFAPALCGEKRVSLRAGNAKIRGLLLGLCIAAAANSSWGQAKEGRAEAHPTHGRPCRGTLPCR